MKKIYLLMEDWWHRRDVILPGMEAALGKDGFVATSKPEEIPWDKLQDEASVFVSQKGEDQKFIEGTGHADGEIEHWITDERIAALSRFVNGGGGALFIHCGTVLGKAPKAYYDLVGGGFIRHPEQCAVTFAPLKGKDGNPADPITEGVDMFTVPDEHYHCNLDLARVTPFMLSVSEGNAAVVAGWRQEIGSGRTVALTPGHTLEAATNPNMTRLIKNAVKWLTGK
jgi:type 1 glutamine amidotransferase